MAKYAADGRPGNALRTLLHIPALADGFLSFPAYLTKESTLLPRHRALLILRTAWLLNNDYLWSEHVPAARTAGLTAGDVRRVAEGPDARGWSAFEATLLRVADQLFRNSFVNDAVYKALTAEYDVHHTIDAIMTVADFLTLGSMYNALGIQPDAWNPDRIPADVPYRVVVPKREAALTAPRVEPVAGTGLAITRTFARHPALAAARKELGYVNQQMKLDARTRELVILRIGWNCQSAYEWAQHVGSFGKAREMGLPIENIARGPDAPGWSRHRAGAVDGHRRAVSRFLRLRPNVGDAVHPSRRGDDRQRADQRGSVPAGLCRAQHLWRSGRARRRTAARDRLELSERRARLSAAPPAALRRRLPYGALSLIRRRGADVLQAVPRRFGQEQGGEDGARLGDAGHDHHARGQRHVGRQHAPRPG